MIDRTEIEKREYIAAFDGLRAIAIMSIVGHQMMAYRIPGGFLGLNIFLLLSGYFMTASLMDSLMKNGKVLLKSFLTKRLKRIIVPTFAMIVAVIFYLLLFQRELLVNLRSTMVSNLFFMNNWWQIIQENDHAITVLTQSPFSHLWYMSLAVQYYLLWPILFVFLSVMIKKHQVLQKVVIVLLVASVLLMMTKDFSNDHFLRIFFGTDTRAFSVLTGAVVALLFPIQKFYGEYKQKYRYESVIRFVPIVLLVLFLFTLKEHSSITFRGGMFIFDIIVAVLLMISLHPKSVTSLFFRLKPLTVIGRRSLSYYLWYLPLSVLYQAKIGDTSSTPVLHRLVEIVLLVILGELWYQLFERGKFTKVMQRLTSQWSHSTRRTVKIVYHFSIIMILVIGFIQASPRLSAQESALQEVLLTSESLSKNTRNTDKKIVKTINNIQGLSREETVFSSNTSITFIGDTMLLAMAQEIPTLYPNAVIGANRDLQVYELGGMIDQLKQQKQLGDIIVLMVGSNGAYTKGQLDSVLKNIGMDKQIFLVSNTINRTWQREINQIANQLADKYSNVYYIDWKTEASTHPDWFYEKASIVNTTGAHQQGLWIAKMIYQTLRGS